MENFRENQKVVTTVFMSTEDIGGQSNIELGTVGIIFSVPSDSEELVGVVINGELHYLPQDVFDKIN